MTALESQALPLSSIDRSKAQAIVVLGGGTERDWYAAKLQRETRLPLLISGEEAIAMARKITNDFATPIQWMETKSHTTEENAKFSAKILKPVGIRRILLVTNASHMFRAKSIFTYNGFEVIPVPVTFTRPERLSGSDFMPSSEGLKRSRPARHELMGIMWFYVEKIFNWT
ncbi:YdcF family protein [Glaciimonas sp. PCH181]|uniref:YdcF family protein n=1 Tax=Glaciimonas sp. PCH181 TaxID=2133943 RepID=UPI001374E09E|nr:YdcF family protein [Glaciimonas sp. PCH181]